MALVLTSRSAAWGNDIYPTNSHNIGSSNAGYYAGEVPFGSGSREIPHNDGRSTTQWCYVTPKVTARLNRDHSITITRIEATGLKFCYEDNGIPVGTRLWGMTGDYFVRASNGNNWWWDKIYNWTTSYYTNSLASYCTGLSPASRTVWAGSHTIPCGGSWEVDVAEYVSNGGELGLNRTVTVKMSNTYSKPAPQPPSLSVSCGPSTTTATVGSFSASGDYGYCDNQSNSTKWYLYRNSDMTGLVSSGSGSSSTFSGLAPNTKYYVNVIRNNGCFVVERNCSFTTLTPNTLSDPKATAWNAGCVRVAVQYGGKVYPPTTTVKIRKCNGGSWKTVGTTDTTTVDTVCFGDLEEETCYQVQACTQTTAGTYCGNTVTFTTPKKCVQGVVTSTDVVLDKKTWAVNATVCVHWEAYAAPASLAVQYRVKGGFNPEWIETEPLLIPGPVPNGGKLEGDHCFVLPTLFPNLTEYEMRLHGMTDDGTCDLLTDPTTFTTPLVPEPDPVKVCETMTYLSELICQSVKKLYDGNKAIFANPTSAELCDPYSDNPTHLTIWSRILRFFHGMNCLLCNMADVGLKSGTDKQYYVGEIGWVDVLEEVLSDEDSESWRIVASNAIQAYIDAKLHEVWHYHKTVDYIVGNRDEMLALPSNAASCIVAAENKVYVKSGSAWVEALPKDQPDNFAVYHINNAYKSSFGDVKAESAWYYFEGTWNNLDANTAALAKEVDEMWDKRGEASFNEPGTDRMYIQVNQANFDYSQLGCDKRRVCFVVEDMEQPPKGYHRVKFVTGEQATLIQDQDVLDGATAQQPADPQRTGYTFNGWSKQGETTPYDWSSRVTEDLILEAKWIANVYNVTFDLNGATGTAPAAITAEYGTSITLPDDTGFSMAGGQFLGWMRDGVPFYAADKIVGDTVLKAMWAMDEFDVVFHPENGQPDIPVHLTYGSSPAVQADPVKDDFIFIGWFTSPTPGTGAPFSFNEAMLGPMDVYARYVPSHYTITYDSAGGSDVPAQTVAYNSYPTAPASPTKDGMVFGYWMKDGRRYYFDEPITKDVDLVARWLHLYTVKFIDSFGDTVSPDQQIVEGSAFGVLLPVPPARPDYTFDGWYTSDGHKWNGDTDVVTSDMTLTAVYRSV